MGRLRVKKSLSLATVTEGNQQRLLSHWSRYCFEKSANLGCPCPTVLARAQGTQFHAL